MFLKRFGVLTAVLAIGIAACGGTSNNVTDPLPHGTAVTSSGSAVSAGGVSGITANLTVTGSGNVNAAESSSAPGNLPALMSVTRSSGKTTQSVKTAATPNAPLVYVTITASAAATISSLAGSTFTFSTAPAAPVYLAYYNGAAWVTVGSAGTISGNTVTFGSSTTFSPSISLAAGASLYLAVYTGAILVAPTPVPSPVSSPNPVSMSLLTTTTVDVATNAGLAVTATSSNTAVATVTASATAGTNGEAAFTVQAVGAGTTTLTFTDAIGHTTTDAVTVTNTLPTPVPSLSSFVLAAADSTTITVSTAANLTITATSNNTAAATVTSSAQANGLGQATFTVAGIASGIATLTFSDQYGDSSTASVDVSPVEDPTFANGFNNPAGTAAWAPCSYNRTSLTTGAINPSPPPFATGNQAPPTATTPLPTLTVTNDTGVVTPPPNLNPNVTATGVPTAIPSSVGLVGGSPAPSGGEMASVTEGAVGICQTLTLDTTNKYLSFWVYEAAGASDFEDGDQEVAVLTAPGGSLATPPVGGATSPYLFAELNCFVDPGVIGLSTFGLTSHCIPAAYGGTATAQYQGGYWVQRGPYDMTQYATAGNPLTLYFGVWYFETKAYPATFGMAMFIANVQMTSSNTFPTSTPLSKYRGGALALPTSRATAAMAAKSRSVIPGH